MVMQSVPNSVLMLSRWSASRRQQHSGKTCAFLQPAQSPLSSPCSSSTISPSRAANGQSRHRRSTEDQDWWGRAAGREQALFVGGLWRTSRTIAESSAAQSIRRNIFRVRRATRARQVGQRFGWISRRNMVAFCWYEAAIKRVV